MEMVSLCRISFHQNEIEKKMHRVVLYLPFKKNNILFMLNLTITVLLKLLFHPIILLSEVKKIYLLITFSTQSSLPHRHLPLWSFRVSDFLLKKFLLLSVVDRLAFIQKNNKSHFWNWHPRVTYEKQKQKSLEIYKKKLLFQRPDSFTSIHLLKLTRLLRLARLLQKMDRYLLLSLIDHGSTKNNHFKLISFTLDWLLDFN